MSDNLTFTSYPTSDQIIYENEISFYTVLVELGATLEFLVEDSVERYKRKRLVRGNFLCLPLLKKAYRKTGFKNLKQIDESTFTAEKDVYTPITNLNMVDCMIVTFSSSSFKEDFCEFTVEYKLIPCYPQY